MRGVEMKRLFDFFGFVFFAFMVIAFAIGNPRSLFVHFYTTVGVSIFIILIIFIQSKWPQMIKTPRFFYGMLLAAVITRFLVWLLGGWYLSMSANHQTSVRELGGMFFSLTLFGGFLVVYIFYSQAWKPFNVWSEERRLDS